MKITDDDKKKLSELRKIERQAKQLVYKMQRLEQNWKQLRAELKQSGSPVAKTLGDVLARWNRF